MLSYPIITLIYLILNLGFTKDKIGRDIVKKIIKKFVEMYAKNSTNSCWWLIFHQTKAPKCLIKK